MKKLMILMALALIGLTTMAQEKPEAAAASTSALIPVYASIQFSLQPNGPSGDFWIETSSPVASVVTYTVTFTGHTKGDWYFTVWNGSSASPHSILLQAIAGRGTITAVSPTSDGTYDYTPAIGAEIEW